MADELIRALSIAQELLHSYQTSSIHLWHPRLSLAWFGVSPSTIIPEENDSLAGRGHSFPESSVDPCYRHPHEVLQEISDRSFQHDILDVSQHNRRIAGRIIRLLWFKKKIRFLWNCSTVLRVRLILHEFLTSFRKTCRNHLKHAFKHALGVSLLAIPAFMPTSTAARQWFVSFRGQWMLISYVWVLQTNTGATVHTGYLRTIGTVFGAIYAYIASQISKDNSFGLVIFMTLAEIPVSAIIMQTPFPSLGIVANITIPPILFTEYVTGEHISAGKLAAIWGLMICAGIAAVLVNSFVFPRYSRVMFLNGMGQILGSLTELYMGLSRDLLQPFGASSHSKRKALKLELKICNSLQRMSSLIMTMADELSLVPMPVEKYRDLVRILQKLLDLFTGLRKIRENIPRKETVIEVVDQRRELISCICISLFVCQQVFSARHPLPQFLPSSRLALESLSHSIDLHIRQTRKEINSPLGLPLIYALAETQILTDIVDNIDKLLELGRQLFGTAAWFNGPNNVAPAMASTNQ
ncbi:hypothetical protein GYMLUDRAFT_156220 [Collybiopsis luxurians FD-317 M1]|nr:hypothetical protein GYMLUDRAFT_156220 [Collybiopsis luxurians FD-317 M1]